MNKRSGEDSRSFYIQRERSNTTLLLRCRSVCQQMRNQPPNPSFHRHCDEKLEAKIHSAHDWTTFKAGRLITHYFLCCPTFAASATGTVSKSAPVAYVSLQLSGCNDFRSGLSRFLGTEKEGLGIDQFWGPELIARWMRFVLAWLAVGKQS